MKRISYIKILLAFMLCMVSAVVVAQNNKTYTYTITEQTVQGYSISYTNQTASAVKDIMQIVNSKKYPKLPKIKFLVDSL